MTLLESLIEKKIVGPRDVPAIEAEQAKTGATLEEVLQKMGIDDGVLLSSKSETLNIPARKVNEKDITEEVFSYIPEDSAKHYKFVPIGMKDGVLEVGIVDPNNIEARDALNFISSKRVTPFKIFLISEADFQKVIESYGGLTEEVTEALDELETEMKQEKELEKGEVYSFDEVFKK